MTILSNSFLMNLSTENINLNPNTLNHVMKRSTLEKFTPQKDTPTKRPI